MKLQLPALVLLATAVIALAADPKKKDEKKKAPPPPRNAVAELAAKANRPTLVGIVEVTKNDKGFLRATFTADDGQKFTIINPAIVEELNGQKVKIVYADLKTDPKSKARSLRVEEVQKLPR
ncbi:MAG: hypothetical protein N2652_10325 [Kiritimatiellae bacterium]|nr:hypothetical protein [Kiritimatiellia bacterium]